MNKRIFSLVCTALYALLDASIYCSEQKNDQSKEYVLRSRIIRAIKQIKRSNKKNDIEPQRENQSNNNKDVFDDEANFKHIRSKKFKNSPYRYTNYYEPFDSYDNPYYSYNGYPPHDVCDSL
ncbi:fam-c protein [Plasmodium vinckei brucechwatti]|uniref:Fam-c protein n=1 Tax=Plasmodium vinckei brucechwatti TaxID=119398 RepID=A0A6V7RXH7_PLAVN|nr:fam-c protein [Plasmodium vinckei brucechwatti]